MRCSVLAFARTSVPFRYTTLKGEEGQAPIAEALVMAVPPLLRVARFGVATRRRSRPHYSEAQNSLNSANRKLGSASNASDLTEVSAGKQANSRLNSGFFKRFYETRKCRGDRGVSRGS